MRCPTKPLVIQWSDLPKILGGGPEYMNVPLQVAGVHRYRQAIHRIKYLSVYAYELQ